MTENATVPEDRSDREPLPARIRTALRRYNPLYLGPLGLLSLLAGVHERLAVLAIFDVFYLFFLWVFVGPLVDAVLGRWTERESEPTDWIHTGGGSELLVAVVTMPLGLLNPLVLVQDLFQFAGSWLAGLARHRGSLPAVDTYEQSVAYRLPFDGEWTVVNGSPEREYSHSWIYPSQRYAYDCVVTDDEGRTRPTDAPGTVDAYYCYDRPVLAPADGVVVEAADARFQTRRAGGISHPASGDIRGGYVVLKHAEDEFSLLAHLRPGSVAVAPGDRVTRGQEVGRCGHTGNSSEPHLHFQVQDHPTFELATTLPVQFDDVAVDSPGVAHDPELVAGHTIADGVRERAYVVAGQRVAHVDDGTVEDGADDEAVGEETRDRTLDTGTDDPDPAVATGSARTATAAAAPDADVSGWFRPLQRTAFGLAVGGVVLFVARFVLDAWLLPAALGGLGALALAVGLLARQREDGAAGGAVAVPVGLLLAAASLAALSAVGVGSGTAVGVLVLCGGLGYALVAEYARRRLPRVTPDPRAA